MTHHKTNINKLTKEHLENHVKILEANVSGLAKALEEAKAKLERLTKPRVVKSIEPVEGQAYWTIAATGSVQYTTFNGKMWDLHAMNCGNSFESEAMTELAREKQYAEAKLLRMCDGEVGKEHFDITYSKDKGFEAESWICRTSSPYHFATKSSCNKAIYTMTKRELRLIFNIPVED